MFNKSLYNCTKQLYNPYFLNNHFKLSIINLNCNLKKYHSFNKSVDQNKKHGTNNFSLTNSTWNNHLYEVLKLRDKNTSNSIIDSSVNDLCAYYKCLNKENKRKFILELACKYSIQHKDVCTVANNLVNNQCNECQNIRLQEKLKTALTPKYKWLFIHIGRQENGVKFLVDMRTDVLDLLQEKNQTEHSSIAYLQQLNSTLRDMFLLWFSVGFLKLERVTWNSSCEMLEKISEYEAVHPVRNWTDLKKRMGRDRRCFVYTHSSMPEEPLVILHTALRGEIVNSTSSMITQTNNNEQIQKHHDSYHPDRVRAAIFYSISSTQIGLQGIELGNYLIKRVATELRKEFPNLHKFSSLSPIPNFKKWFYDILKRANNDSQYAQQIFTTDELNCLKEILKCDNVFIELMKKLNSNCWLQINGLADILKPIMMKVCIKYLYVEKKRGYALDSVANFHLRNGAEMWRINWLADTSARGLSTSCGIMVNYRYYLDEAETNSKNYIENKKIPISSLVKELLVESNVHFN